MVKLDLNKTAFWITLLFILVSPIENIYKNVLTLKIYYCINDIYVFDLLLECRKTGVKFVACHLCRIAFFVFAIAISIHRKSV